MSPNHGDYVVFQFIPGNVSFGFRTYTDAIGQVRGFVEGKDKDGQPIYRRWKFDRDTRKISVHKNKTDLNNLNAVDFLRESPFCKGSPNGYYNLKGEQLEVYFEEVNEGRAAEEAIKFETMRLDAQNYAVAAKGQELIDLASMIGVFHPDEPVLKFSVMEYAKNKPASFMEIYNDPVRKLKSLIRRGVSSGIISQEGTVYKWENQLVGLDEDDAAKTLKDNEAMFKAIKAQIDKLDKPKKQ